MIGQKWIENILFPGTCFSRQQLEQVIRGKTILITGATYGIGEALVYKLKGISVRLILMARTEEKLQQLQKELARTGTEVIWYAVDLYQAEQVEQVAARINALSLDIDILVHNAGKSICRPIQQSATRFHDYTRTMAVNYASPVQLSLAFLPGLVRCKGQIIYVSAINVLFSSVPGWSAYQASKTAMDQWGRAAAMELEREGVTVTAIYLPLVRTRMIEPTAAYRTMPAMSPDKAATLLASAMIRRFRSWAPWWTYFPVTCSRLFPALWERIAWNSFKRNSS